MKLSVKTEAAPSANDSNTFFCTTIINNTGFTCRMCEWLGDCSRSDLIEWYKDLIFICSVHYFNPTVVKNDMSD